MSDYLSDDLISEIFTRLPIKPLLRLRSLSKSWYSCISSPGFIRMHSLRSSQKVLITHKRLGQSEYFYTLHSEDRLPLCRYMDISQVEAPYRINSYVGSCNGILCLEDYKGGISLWNPSIGRQLVVPDCPRRCSSRVLHGFGFDPITDDYKIVSISFPKENRGTEESSFVYSTKTSTWCAIASLIHFFSDVTSDMCFVNGALHWVVEGSYTESDDMDRSYILTFDLSTHVFGTIALPQPSYKASGLTAIQGSLVVISTVDDDNSWIWVKRDASWSVVFKLSTDQLPGYIHGVLQLSKTGHMLLCYDWLKVYNPKTQVRSRLVDFNASSYVYHIQMFVESLYLLDVMSACESNQLSPLGGKKCSKIRQ